MQKRILSCFGLSLLLLLNCSTGLSAPQVPGRSFYDGSGTLEKMIVANGNVSMDLDLSRLNGSETKMDRLRFQVGSNSFFTVLVFNDVFRGPDAGSMALIPQNSVSLPDLLQTSLNQLVIEKLPSD